MCGIVYSHDFTGRSVNNLVLNQFDAQRKRGTQGFGLYDGQEGNIVRATEEDKILKWLCEKDSNLLLFHHRLPTSSPNEKKQAHPFTTKDYFGDTQYILVHNGHIGNAWTLKYDHQQVGIEYRTERADFKFNDSEALLWDIALYLEGKQDKLKAVGPIAFVCLKLVKGELDKLYFGRNVNPLNMYREKAGLLLSSEGVGEAIAPDVLYTWNYELKRMTTKMLEMPLEVERTHTESTNWRSDNYNHSEPTAEELRALEQIDEDDRWESLEEMWEREVGEHSVPDVKSFVTYYLNNAQGNYEIAYDDMEFDYGQIAEDAVTLEELQEMKMYEQAMRLLEEDGNWIGPESVSPEYKQLSMVKEESWK